MRPAGRARLRRAEGGPYGPLREQHPGRLMGVKIMYRVIAVLACSFALTACTSSWMPSFEMPSFGGGGGSGVT